MKKTLVQACALFVGATAVQAGGIDRSGQGVNILFEKGSAVQFRLGYASPDISGTVIDKGVEYSSGEIGQDFFVPHLAYKKALNEKLDLALIYDQPFGADVEYAKNYPLSVNPIPGWRSGVLTAKADTDALTALLRYKFDNGFSAIAGLRAQRLKTDVTVPKAMGYEVQADPDTGFGYVVGVAWEKPEIAARVALTYNSKISHDLSQTESYNPVPGGTVPLGKVDAFKTESEVVLPQSINLDFQTGVAPKTLLFGSVRWADWPQLVYAPEYYTSIVGKNLVDHKSRVHVLTWPWL